MNKLKQLFFIGLAFLMPTMVLPKAETQHSRKIGRIPADFLCKALQVMA